MRVRFGVSTYLLIAALAVAPTLSAQVAAPSEKTKNQSSEHVDLSGVWGNLGNSVPAAGSKETEGPYQLSPKGTMKDAGTPADGVPYQPWAMAKLQSERPPSGPRATFDRTTDPNIQYCELYGVPRIYNSPSKFKFVRTPEAVYILYEYGVVWRVVWLNRKHSGRSRPHIHGGVDLSWVRRQKIHLSSIRLASTTRRWRFDHGSWPHQGKLLHLTETHSASEARTNWK